MKDKILLLIVLMLLILTAFCFYKYFGPIQILSTISENNTADPLKEINSTHNTNEIVIVFKDGTSEDQIRQITNEINGEIIDKLPDINNYRIRINKKMNTEETLNLLEKINLKNEVTLASLGENLKNNDKNINDINSSNINNNKIQDTALANYNKPVNIYHSNDGLTFLYPEEWEMPKEGILINKKEHKEVNYIHKKSALFLFENEINNYINEDKQKGYTKDGELDQYEQGDLIITKWIMKKGNSLLPRALIQGKDFYYYFTSKDKVSLDEFTLIVDTFITTNSDKK
ncbi:S8 family serine peptidase [Bacillus sp. Brlt_9]|uniref:S8 family serine peptidase n=1 Tax=Bacillus sp. Brlt_9 TaxID=3110916 RepID=UPI003F7CBFB0